MKNFTLSLTFIFSLSFCFSQCVPDSIYADSTFGVWPTPQTNFPPGDVGIPYYEVVNFKVPRDAGAIDSAAAGTFIDSIVLTSISNIPPGLSYDCDNSSCSWRYDSLGCASLSGTPTTVGSYQISLDATVWTQLFFTPFPIPYSFDGYVINIGNTGIKITNLDNSFLSLQKAIPNPSNESTKIQYLNNKIENVVFEVTNLLGERIYFEYINSKRGVNEIYLNTNDFKNGIYIYSINNGRVKSSKRLVVNH